MGLTALLWGISLMLMSLLAYVGIASAKLLPGVMRGGHGWSDHRILVLQFSTGQDLYG